MYVVTGVSGKTGSAVATALLNKGQKVRVVVRREEKGTPWAALGAEVAVSSFEDRYGFMRALEGASGAYLVVPPSLITHDPVNWYRGFAEDWLEGMAYARLRHAVVLSALGSHRVRPFEQLHAMERALSHSSTPVTFLRASFFMENLLQSLPVMQCDGKLPCFMDPNVSIPMVACKDIGQQAAALMMQGPGHVQAVEITGPMEYSYADAAGAFAMALGSAVQPVRIPDNEIIPNLIQFGASPEMASFFRSMYEALGRGDIQPQGGEVPFHRGRTRLEDAVPQLVAASRAAYLG